MKNKFFVVVLIATSCFANASDSVPQFLTCASKTYTFVVIPGAEEGRFFEGAYFKGALVSYALTNGNSVQTLPDGKQVWRRNGGFVATVDTLEVPPDVDPNIFDSRRPFKIEDADGDETRFPTETGTCSGSLGLTLSKEIK
jgi:hypothetical protein